VFVQRIEREPEQLDSPAGPRLRFCRSA
jgi:hypothetical protein